MPQGLDLDSLDDTTVVVILSRLTQELRGRLSEEQVDAVSEPEDALRLIAAAAGKPGQESDQAVRDGRIPRSSNVPAAARRQLELLARDERLRPKLEALVERPLRRSPAPLDPATAAAVILDTTAAWLQTSVPIDYQDGEEEVDFELHLERSAVSLQLVKEAANAVLEFVSGGSTTTNEEINEIPGEQVG